jgi:hypothetical protein
VLAEFGGPEHISGLKEAPFPHLEVVAGFTAPGDFKIRPVEGQVDFTVWGAPTNEHGNHLLRRLSLVVVGALLELPDVEYRPGDPVVSLVDFPRSPTPQHLTNGQRRWLFSASFRMRPATA